MTDSPPRPWQTAGGPSASFIKHVLVVVGIASLVFLLWKIRSAVLLAFAAIIVATLLLAIADPVRRYGHLSQRWSVTTAGGTILIIVVLMSWLVGSQVQTQFGELASRLPQAVSTLEERFGVTIPGSNLLTQQGDRQDRTAEADEEQTADRRTGQQERRSQQDQGFQFSSDLFSISQDLLSRMTSIGATVLEGLANLILVVVAGFFLAADPATYTRGLLKLFPVSRHRQAEETLNNCGRALRQWLLAQLVAMALVGILVGLGTWLIGLPAPIALGLFAGVTEFIPIVGPFIGALPAVLLALNEGFTMVLWTIGLYVVIQQIESNLITPIVERRMVKIPPALLLFAVLSLGLLFGMIGLFVAAPLTVVLYVAVKRLYVRDTLGEQTEVPAEK